MHSIIDQLSCSNTDESDDSDEDDNKEEEDYSDDTLMFHLLVFFSVKLGSDQSNESGLSTSCILHNFIFGNYCEMELLSAVPLATKYSI